VDLCFLFLVFYPLSAKGGERVGKRSDAGVSQHGARSEVAVKPIRNNHIALFLKQLAPFRHL
jgi:hypothetical protein